MKAYKYLMGLLYYNFEFISFFFFFFLALAYVENKLYFCSIKGV